MSLSLSLYIYIYIYIFTHLTTHVITIIWLLTEEHLVRDIRCCASYATES